MSNPQKILLIDDDATIAELVRFLIGAFRRGPFALTHVATFEDGLRELLTGAYDLCLLDYRLGPRDGLELLREAKTAQCYTPIIMLTGDGGEETDLAAMDGGAADFMHKTELNARALERAVCYALKMSAAVNELRDLASVDELTQLLNRREFDRRLQEEWGRGVRFRRPLALMLMDLDKFKQINDTHGHPVGDEVLRHVAKLLAAQVRQVDFVARIGGDEFALLLVESDRRGADVVAARIRDIVAATPLVLASQQLTVQIGISVGVAAWPEDATSKNELVEAADAALYECKRRGRTQAPSASL